VSGEMMNGGVKGRNTNPSWAVMRHTRIPVWMIEDSFSSRRVEVSRTWTKIPVWAESLGPLVLGERGGDCDKTVV
jgi:hypothetical protein